MSIEEQLQHSEEKYRHLFEKSPNLILLFDRETKRLVDTNNRRIGSAEKNLTSQLVGKNFLEIISKLKNSKEIIEIFKKRSVVADRGEALEPIELPIITQDGNRHWIN